MASNTIERTGVVEDTTTGEKFIPASRRPDGTWRKPRRVKDGYVPQEEMPVYENKGVQWLKSKPSLPPGLDPSLVSSGDTTGMSKSAKKNAKKKEKKKQQQEQSNQSGAPIQNVTQSLASVNLNTDKSSAGKKIDHKADSASSKQADAGTESQDVTKKLRALRKKLRQIEDIENRLQSGELKNPEKDQLDKVERKKHVLEEIADLELKLEN